MRGGCAELQRFAVQETQGLIDSIAAELKSGKSEVACEQGQLAKVSKDRSGIVTQERLTKLVRVDGARELTFHTEILRCLVDIEMGGFVHLNDLRAAHPHARSDA
jgi:hypothetical protein